MSCPSCHSSDPFVRRFVSVPDELVSDVGATGLPCGHEFHESLREQIGDDWQRSFERRRPPEHHARKLDRSSALAWWALRAVCFLGVAAFVMRLVGAA